MEQWRSGGSDASARFFLINSNLLVIGLVLSGIFIGKPVQNAEAIPDKDLI